MNTSIKRVDRHRGFKIRVEWKSDEGDSETGSYWIEVWLSNHTDGNPHERRKVTNSVVEGAIESVLAEKAQDDAEFESAEVYERHVCRRVKPDN